MLTPLKIQLTDKLSPFLFKNKRIKVAFGGRGGTKSQTIVDILLYKVQQEGLKVGCFREHQNTIEDSVHSLLKDEIHRIEIPGFIIQKTYIDHVSGGVFRFKGLARNLMGVKSAHGFDIFFIEEGQFLSEESLRTLIPTLRTQGSELWIILNPGSREDPVSKRYIVPFYKHLLKDSYYEDEHHLVVWTNYDENPWFPAELEADRKRDFEFLTRAEYDHIWRGYFNDTVEHALIKAEWFDAAVDAHLKIPYFGEPVGTKILSHDPSDLGSDDKGLLIKHGSHWLAAETKHTGEVDEGMSWALERAIQEQVDVFVWDCDGIGGGCKYQVKKALKGKPIRYIMFKGSEGVDKPFEVFDEPGKYLTDKSKQRTNFQMLKNNRAQKYWSIRNRFFRTYLAVEKNEFFDPDLMISVHSDIKEIDVLRSEISRIPRKPNPNGLIQIMSKKEMAKPPLNIASPNLADSGMMADIDVDILIESMNDIDFDSPWGAS